MSEQTFKNIDDILHKDAGILQKKTFYGKEKKSLAYIIGTIYKIKEIL